ncbi:MAG: hypothetical protein AAF638_05935 [Pseudomonadota bacterium]
MGTGLTLRNLISGLALFFMVVGLLADPARSDPVGSYDVVGTNPDNGGEYRGTVTVSRRGDTYEVLWQIGNDQYIGTALGAELRDNRFLVGPASADDIAISVGYVSASIFGIAMYFEQADGTWEGVWTYDGSGTVASEVWFPR